MGIKFVRLLMLVPFALVAGSEAAEPTAQSPVVLELFTSQGCSSCPSADRLLSKLAESEQWRGKILPLAFHVDYWNYIGWTDPFSSRQWSLRQERYADAWKSTRIYTPQLVFNGVEECVGSDEAGIGRLLRKLSRETSAFAVSATAQFEADGLAVKATAQRLDPAGATEPHQLLVAVFENGLVTEVGRGENARRTLRDDFVVRVLVVMGPEGRVKVPLPPGWQRSQLGVVAFVEETQTRRIRGAALVPLSAPEPTPSGAAKR